MASTPCGVSRQYNSIAPSLPAYLHLAILMIGFFVKLIIWPKKLGRADMYDLVIRGGTVVDGSGGAPFVADVAIDGDRIVAVGENLGAGSENIDASGKIVTPGFADVHPHSDRQAQWEAAIDRKSPRLNSSLSCE